LTLYLALNIYQFTITTAILGGETSTQCTIHAVLDKTFFKGQDFIYETDSVVVTDLLLKDKTDSLAYAIIHIMQTNV